jgi:hypothetical protein
MVPIFRKFVLQMKPVTGCPEVEIFRATNVGWFSVAGVEQPVRRSVVAAKLWRGSETPVCWRAFTALNVQHKIIGTAIT